ncbi:MAG TPA: ABC transporter [Thiothrix sp.]|nr:ABC transporter [Thiothrix sp.]
MKITPKSHWYLRLNNSLFYALFVIAIGLLGYLGTQYTTSFDWTYGQRNTLSPVTQNLLGQLDQPLKFSVYIPEQSPLKTSLTELFDKYKRFKKDIDVEFVDPNLNPKRIQQDGVQYAGQIAVHYGQRHELIESTSEQTIVETLQRLGQNKERFVVFLEGHNERNPFGEESSAMGTLISTLQRKGVQVQPHNLVRSQRIPDNTSFLVIASPQKDLLAGEVKVIMDYLNKGGNLLWLHEPGTLHGLKPVQDLLGLQILNGTLVDANQELQYLLGINSPAVIPIVDYGASILTQGLNGSPSLFPFATAIERADTEQAELWEFDPFLLSLPSSWLETGNLEGEIRFEADKNDQAGPLPIGVGLSRLITSGANKKTNANEMKDKASNQTDDNSQEQQREQRIVVVGDSDFMLNAFIGQGVNLDLASNIFNWLNQSDQFIQVNLQSAPDVRLATSETMIRVNALFFMILLPLGLLIYGVWMWWQRRKA